MLKMQNKTVFLGGTCNDSSWRQDLITILEVSYFNPVVTDWTPECMAEEIHQRNSCNYNLYVITSQMTGVYSIAELIDDSNKRPSQTLFFIDSEGFDSGALKSLHSVCRMALSNGATEFKSLVEIAAFLNKLPDQSLVRTELG